MKTLITGASSGIGLELARIFARERSDLVLVARGKQKLDEVAAELRNSGVQVQVLAKDLAWAGAPDEIQREAGPVDVLVNNAGFGSFGEFAGTPLTEDLNLMRVNMEALVSLSKLFLPGMIQARSGRILNVASTAAFQPGPLMALYYASKAFVLSFSEAIANELHGTGVTVTVLCPGPTETDFQRRANMDESGLVKRLGAMDARTVAEAGYRGLMSGKTIVIPGMKNRMLAESVRFAPRKLVTAITRKMQDRV
ncbi:MAG TPA: SDR family oxidoreductase [Bryobacteraceae bacterium]|nr:SDR family oxidoreductase [Bryobacteraceae bacterium]